MSWKLNAYFYENIRVTYDYLSKQAFLFLLVSKVTVL